MKYDDTVSVFSADTEMTSDLNAGQNIFDLWIGNAEFD